MRRVAREHRRRGRASCAGRSRSARARCSRPRWTAARATGTSRCSPRMGGAAIGAAAGPDTRTRSPRRPRGPVSGSSCRRAGSPARGRCASGSMPRRWPPSRHGRRAPHGCRCPRPRRPTPWSRSVSTSPSTAALATRRRGPARARRRTSAATGRAALPHPARAARPRATPRRRRPAAQRAQRLPDARRLRVRPQAARGGQPGHRARVHAGAPDAHRPRRPGHRDRPGRRGRRRASRVPDHGHAPLARVAGGRADDGVGDRPRSAGVRAGDPRIAGLLRRARVLVVPVVNPDGFVLSREVGGAFEFKRKNCRVQDLAIPTGAVRGAGQRGARRRSQPQLRQLLGRRPGASLVPTDDAYRGAGPFSEPESQNIHDLVATRPVVTVVSNHTFGNLMLRPPSVRSLGEGPDARLLAELGDAMAAAGGLTSQHAYDLYDTTGSAEDWAYWSAGAPGFTPEIGPETALLARLPSPLREHRAVRLLGHRRARRDAGGLPARAQERGGPGPSLRHRRRRPGGEHHRAQQDVHDGHVAGPAGRRDRGTGADVPRRAALDDDHPRAGPFAAPPTSRRARSPWAATGASPRDPPRRR